MTYFDNVHAHIISYRSFLSSPDQSPSQSTQMLALHGLKSQRLDFRVDFQVHLGTHPERCERWGPGLTAPPRPLLLGTRFLPFVGRAAMT